VENIELIETVLKKCAKERLTPMIWGRHGIGKSQIIRQLFESLSYEVIDLRLGQLEVGDLIGMPAQEFYCPNCDTHFGFGTKSAYCPVCEQDGAKIPILGKTVWLPPSWFPANGEKRCIFFDEFNRGRLDVQQAAFQIVLDRRIHTHKIPDNCMIICACFKGDSLILGDNKKISDYQIGDTVLGKNGIQLVTNTFSRNYNGKMLTIKGRGILPFTVTPEHPIYINDSWKKASAITKGMKLFIPKITGNISLDRINIKKYSKDGKSKVDYLPLGNDLAWLLGCYVADGWGHEKDGGAAIQSNSKNAEKIKTILSALGIHFNVVSSEIRIGSSNIGRMLRDLCGSGAPNKKIPDCVLYNTNLDVVRGFLDGYSNDAHQRGNRLTASTVSRILAMQLQLLLTRLDILPAICENLPRKNITIKGKKVKNTLPFYTIDTSLLDNKSKPRWYKNIEKGFLVEVEDITEELFDGIVYNIETRDNTYLASNAVVHNCNPPSTDSGNGMEYNVEETDPALLDRFVNMKFTLTTKNWLKWAREHSIMEELVDFIATDSKYLGNGAIDIPIDITPSPRSYEFLNKLLHDKEIPQRHWAEIAETVIGPTASIAFMQSLKANIEKPIKAIDIFNNFEKVKPKVKKQVSADGEDNETKFDLLRLTLDEIAQCLDGVKSKKYNEKQLNNLGDFLVMLPKDLAFSIIKDLAQNQDVTERMLMCREDLFDVLRSSRNDIKQ